MTDNLVRRVAKAIYLAGGEDGDPSCYSAEARAAIAEVFDWLAGPRFDERSVWITLLAQLRKEALPGQPIEGNDCE